ncbi:hypothetical protein pipiens_001422 [Culex pipiens pipiens]|uniref:Uncharacterized protein n=1 Tax=Culex pipiens pipiens TaxID=38569 RepID=A0ABD1CUY6_CULPP
MKFALVLAALVAVAFAAPSESSGTLDPEKLQQALIDAGMNPEEAHGFMDFIRSAGRVIRDKVLPAATKILPIATQIAGAFGNQQVRRSGCCGVCARGHKSNRHNINETANAAVYEIPDRRWGKRGSF